MGKQQQAEPANAMAQVSTIVKELDPSQKSAVLANLGISLAPPPPATEYKVVTAAEVSEQHDLVPLNDNMKVLSKQVDPAVNQLVANADPALKKKADDFVTSLLAGNFDRQAKRSSVDGLALTTQQEAAHRSSLLKEPVKALYRSKDGKTVGDGLVQLKQRMMELDPVKFGLSVQALQTALNHSKIGKAIDAYWTKNQDMETVINAVVKSLQLGASQLQRDNEAYAADQEAMRMSTKKLKEALIVVALIDQALERKLAAGEIKDADDMKFIRQELLFPVRQRQMSLQQTLLANQQAILTSDIMISTNREVLRATRDAINISVVQLSNVLALIVGLQHQKDQLTKIQELNKTTEHFMKFGSELLDNQATEVYTMATQTMISMEALEETFAHIRSAFDKVETLRDNALEPMKQSIGRMDKMITDNEDLIAKQDKGKAARAQLKLEV
jgi:uncharacterized protein YaaN involved in tellurite resistance